MSAESVVFRRVADCFIWASDMETAGKLDYWDDFAEYVRAGKVTRRDCEDFALTCLIIGIEDHGFDRSQCRVARVATRQCPPQARFDHAVAIYGDTVFDNRMRGPVPLSSLPGEYRFYDFAYLPITQWRRFAVSEGA